MMKIYKIVYVSIFFLLDSIEMAFEYTKILFAINDMIVSDNKLNAIHQMILEF